MRWRTERRRLGLPASVGGKLGRWGRMPKNRRGRLLRGLDDLIKYLSHPDEEFVRRLDEALGQSGSFATPYATPSGVKSKRPP